MSHKITRGLLLLLLLSTHIGFSSPPVKAQTTKKTICTSQLTTAIDAVVNRPLFNRVRWGILVKNQDSNQTLYIRNGQKYFVPASNTKLLTTAAALQALGENFRIRTSVYQDGEGILRVVGRGDPSFKDAQLQSLAKQLRQKGIRQIKQLIADDNYSQGDMIHPSWMWEDVQYYYGAPVNSLILNENASILRVYPQTLGKPLQVRWNQPVEAYRWRVENNSVTIAEGKSGFVQVTRDLKGPILQINGQLGVGSRPDITAIAVFDPIEHFMRHFRLHLNREGISVARTFTAVGSQNDRELAAVESPPLSELLVETNVNSNNLFAEALLRALANKSTQNNQKNVANIGLKVLTTTLEQLGVNPQSYKIVDGSGLSHKNLISPEALVQTLQGMAKSPQAEIFRASLPISGVSGTLKNRMKGTPAQGIVQAKSGTITGAVTLSGYANPPQYSPIIFSIMANQTGQPSSVMRKAVDEIVVLLTQLKSC
ncbi:MAG: D-alanyl-D-alanine carboxypeptidase/D-alanyl-D-alanine-endopeptidase [Calothrix sp. MO_167.B42]|nr:D-alanyl-D-alanine carboxypeptidase/D-alanyl-D-alanine-endopeptidase [Calothrix sp. MO_167.B42]